MANEENLEIHAIVKGWVQGVGFRFFAERSANQLGIKGWVRNLYNGDVEILAQGSKDSLEKYISALQQGPRSARVKEVEVEWRNPTQKFEYFSITY